MQESSDKVLEWYQAYKSGLYGYIYSLLGNRSDTEDVIQSSFSALVLFGEKIHAIRNPKAYIFQVARNEAMRLFKQRGTPVVSLELLPNDPSDGRRQDKLKEARDAIANALSLLPCEDREIIVLHVYEQLTFHEIAGVTGMFMAKVVTRYYRGLRRMKAFLENEYED